MREKERTTQRGMEGGLFLNIQSWLLARFTPCTRSVVCRWGEDCSSPSRLFECKSLFAPFMTHPRHSRTAAMSFLLFGFPYSLRVFWSESLFVSTGLKTVSYNARSLIFASDLVVANDLWHTRVYSYVLCRTIAFKQVSLLFARVSVAELDFLGDSNEKTRSR